MSSVNFTLTPGAWVSLGSSPCTVQVVAGSSVFLTVQDTAPTSLNTPYHVISTEPHRDDNAVISAAGTVYGRSGGATDAVVTVT